MQIGFGIDYSFFTSLLALRIAFLIVVLIYAVMTFVLLYHWNTFGMEARAIKSARTMYIAVSLLLLCAAGILLIYI